MEPTKLVRYEMVGDDLIAFNLYHQTNSPSVRRALWNSAAFFVIIGGLLAVVAMLEPRMRVLWLFSLVLFYFALAVPFNHRKSVRTIVGRMLQEGTNKGLLGLKEITLTPVEICATGALRSSTTRWPAVEKVVTTEEALYVYISAIEAIVIPRRAFGTSAEFEDFAATARRYQAEAAVRSK